MNGFKRGLLRSAILGRKRKPSVGEGSGSRVGRTRPKIKTGGGKECKYYIK